MGYRIGIWEEYYAMLRQMLVTRALFREIDWLSSHIPTVKEWHRKCLAPVAIADTLKNGKRPEDIS